MGKERWTKERLITAGLLKEMRQQNGLSQQQLADLIHKVQSHVSKMESGERALEIHEIRVVCRACGTTLSDFVERFEKTMYQDSRGTG